MNGRLLNRRVFAEFQNVLSVSKKDEKLRFDERDLAVGRKSVHEGKIVPNKDYTLTMARYNLWQNESQLAVIDDLSPTDREKDRGSFFESIQKTVSHSLWGDMLWMNRFAGTPAPEGGIRESTDLIKSWKQFRIDRRAFDERMLQWAREVSPNWFEGDLSWFSGALGRDVTMPKKTLVIQLFNHQTHHRGQVHAMVTSAGAKPGDTDVPFMPEHFLSM